MTQNLLSVELASPLRMHSGIQGAAPPQGSHTPPLSLGAFSPLGASLSLSSGSVGVIKSWAVTQNIAWRR